MIRLSKYYCPHCKKFKSRFEVVHCGVFRDLGYHCWHCGSRVMTDDEVIEKMIALHPEISTDYLF